MSTVLSLLNLWFYTELAIGNHFPGIGILAAYWIVMGILAFSSRKREDCIWSLALLWISFLGAFPLLLFVGIGEILLYAGLRFAWVILSFPLIAIALYLLRKEENTGERRGFVFLFRVNMLFVFLSEIFLTVQYHRYFFGEQTEDQSFTLLLFRWCILLPVMPLMLAGKKPQAASSCYWLSVVPLLVRTVLFLWNGSRGLLAEDISEDVENPEQIITMMHGLVYGTTAFVLLGVFSGIPLFRKEGTQEEEAD